MSSLIASTTGCKPFIKAAPPVSPILSSSSSVKEPKALILGATKSMIFAILAGKVSRLMFFASLTPSAKFVLSSSEAVTAFAILSA